MGSLCKRRSRSSSISGRCFTGGTHDEDVTEAFPVLAIGLRQPQRSNSPGPGRRPPALVTTSGPRRPMVSNRFERLLRWSAVRFADVAQRPPASLRGPALARVRRQPRKGRFPRDKASLPTWRGPSVWRPRRRAMLLARREAEVHSSVASRGSSGHRVSAAPAMCPVKEFTRGTGRKNTAIEDFYAANEGSFHHSE